MATTTMQTGYAPVNGLELYYEIHGDGEQALILLHGGLGTIEMVADLIPLLAANRRVIACEMQGHGHTADVDRPLSYEGMADDVAALIAHLGLGRCDVVGYSLGGGIAQQVAIRHPDAVGKVVVIAAACKRDGMYPEIVAGQAAITAELAATWVGSPMHDAYARVAPNPEGWTTLAAKTGQMLRQDYDWSADVAAMRAPVLIVVGDADIFPPAHAAEMFGLLGGGKADGSMGDRPTSQLAILPDTTHFTILTRTDLLQPIIGSFLGAQVAGTE